MALNARGFPIIYMKLKINIVDNFYSSIRMQVALGIGRVTSRLQGEVSVHVWS